MTTGPRIHSADDVVQLVQQQLNAIPVREFKLRAIPGAARQDGDWWYVAVTPEPENVRSHLYSDALVSIEEALQEQGLKVMLVPALVDD